MDNCSQCGHRLGVGRYCTNCGHPVAPGEAGTTRTAVLPAPPVDVPEPGGTWAPRHRVPGAAGTPGWLPWLAAFATLVVVAALGAVLLFSGGDDSPGLLKTGPTTEAASAQPGAEPSPEPTETATTGSEAEQQPRAEPADLTDRAAVEAPAPAPTSRDTGGRRVTYAATNMLDGNPATCWRMAGDGTGQSITFTFDQPVELSRVGLVNGYAKVVTDRLGVLDWYRGNRRVQQVEWAFDDGTTATQLLRETTDLQARPIDQVTTQSVTLRLLAVSPPGPGRASRDYTAISDVVLRGTPA